MGKLQVNLLGASFSVKSSEDDKYLSELLSHYREIVLSLKESRASDDPLQLSILAGISLADELHKEKQRNSTKNSSKADQEEAERLTIQMIEKINKVL
ncbi:MAG: cell division protein ZapA [Treponema sp.]|nr:cell division protein ZapA [Treponema sp.]